MSKRDSKNNINNLNKNKENELKKSKNININKMDDNHYFLNQKNIQQDLIFFKDDILKDLREIRQKLFEELSIQKDEQTYKLDLYEKKIEAQTQKIAYLSNLITESMKKTKTEELLEQLSAKTEQDFVKVDFRMNNIQKEIRDGLYKQEKLFNETVLYPGIIGYDCRFSNFHSFVDYVLSNIHQIIVYQELLKGYELHKIKGKIDKDLSIFQLQLKNNFKALSEFTTEKVKESEKKMKNLLDNYNSKFVDLRVENHETANMLKQQINDVANSFGKIIEIKNEIDERYEEQDQKIENLKIDIANNEVKINEQKNEINTFDKKIQLLTRYIDNNFPQDNNNNNNMDMSRNNRAFKGRRVRSAKEYIEGLIDVFNSDNNNENSKKNKKTKKFNFKAESFVKRYIKGKIGIDDMYKHVKDFEDKKQEELLLKNKINKKPILKLSNKSLSEEKIFKDKINNNPHFFNLTTVNSIESPKRYFSDKNNRINYSNKTDEESKLNSQINLNLNLSLSKNNTIKDNKTKIKEKDIQHTSKINEIRNNQSYQLKQRKYNNQSLINIKKNKKFYMDSLDYDIDKYKTPSFSSYNNINMRNSSSQTQTLKQGRPMKIDSISRIPNIDINRVIYPDKETKRKFIITKSLSDGNYNYSNQNKINFDEFFEKRSKKPKQKIKFNKFKSPNNYISKRQTFENKFIRQQFNKGKLSNFILHKPKKKLLIVQ